MSSIKSTCTAKAISNIEQIQKSNNTGTCGKRAIFVVRLMYLHAWMVVCFHDIDAANLMNSDTIYRPTRICKFLDILQKRSLYEYDKFV